MSENLSKQAAQAGALGAGAEDVSSQVRHVSATAENAFGL